MKTPEIYYLCKDCIKVSSIQSQAMEWSLVDSNLKTLFHCLIYQDNISIKFEGIPDKNNNARILRQDKTFEIARVYTEPLHPPT